MLFILIVLIVLVIGGILWWISIGNRFRILNIKINETESGIDVALTKRYDMLTKLLDVCRQYAAYEKDTFAQIAEIRGGMTMQERNEVSGTMDGITGRINALAEAYPALHASEQYQSLQSGIRDVEEQLQASRRLYNGNVSSLNQLLLTFPSSIVGKHLNIKEREFFQAEDAKRLDVSMK